MKKIFVAIVSLFSLVYAQTVVEVNPETHKQIYVEGEYIGSSSYYEKKERINTSDVYYKKDNDTINIWVHTKLADGTFSELNIYKFHYNELSSVSSFAMNTKEDLKAYQTEITQIWFYGKKNIVYQYYAGYSDEPNTFDFGFFTIKTADESAAKKIVDELTPLITTE